MGKGAGGGGAGNGEATNICLLLRLTICASQAVGSNEKPGEE